MAKANTLQVSGANKHHASLGNYYFDALKNSESSAPSGGPEFGEKLKDYAEENIKVTHDLIRHEAVLRIQNQFIHSQLKALATTESVKHINRFSSTNGRFDVGSLSTEDVLVEDPGFRVDCFAYRLV